MMMTTELTVLTLAGLLQVFQYVLMAIPVNLEVGTAKTLSSRDPQRMGGPLMDQVSARTGRLVRALNNHFEALILFTLAVVVVTVSGQSTGFTAGCAWTYLAARILYVPAYAYGWVPGRSIIFGVGLAATTAMLIAALV